MANKKKHEQEYENEDDAPIPEIMPDDDTVEPDADQLTGDIDQILSEAMANSEKASEEADGDVPVVEDISSLKQEVEAGRDRYLRLMAEFDNYKRRTAKEYERMVEGANEKLILEMIDVRENFERALKAGEQGGDAASFIEGMRLIFAKFDEALGRHGLSVFAEPGEQFDPAIHDALMNAPNAEVPADHIAEVFEHGYRLKERVIKHARVIVSGGAGE